MEDKDVREGHDKESAGKLTEAIGGAAGDRELEGEGRIKRAEGEMQQGIGEAKDEVSDAADAARETLND